MRGRIIIALLCIAAGWKGVCADEVVFKNGDRLTGKVKELIRNKMVFESEVAGTVTIDASKIKTFKTDEAVEVHLKDGTNFNQVILEAGPGLFTVKGDEKLQGREFSIDHVDSMDRFTDGKAKWTGDISAGLTATRGNSVTDTSNISLNITRRTKKDRSLLSGYYIKGKQEDPDTSEKITTEDKWWLRGKYDYFFTRKCYVYGDGRYETDAVADLKRRVILGGGLGRQWVESEGLNFSTEAGLASLYEKYDNHTGSSNEISAQLGYHFDVKLNSKLKFITDLTYYPKLKEVSDYFLAANAELRASITEQLFTNFRVIFDYDSTPAQQAQATDVKYIFGVGLKF